MEGYDLIKFTQAVRNGFTALNLPHVSVDVREAKQIAGDLYHVEMIMFTGNGPYCVRALTMYNGHEATLYLEPAMVRMLFIEPMQHYVDKKLEQYTVEHPWLLGV